MGLLATTVPESGLIPMTKYFPCFVQTSEVDKWQIYIKSFSVYLSPFQISTPFPIRMCFLGFHSHFDRIPSAYGTVTPLLGHAPVFLWISFQDVPA